MSDIVIKQDFFLKVCFTYVVFIDYLERTYEMHANITIDIS